MTLKRHKSGCSCAAPTPEDFQTLSRSIRTASHFGQAEDSSLHPVQASLQSHVSQLEDRSLNSVQASLRSHVRQLEDSSLQDYSWRMYTHASCWGVRLFGSYVRRQEHSSYKCQLAAVLMAPQFLICQRPVWPIHPSVCKPDPKLCKAMSTNRQQLAMPAGGWLTSATVCCITGAPCRACFVQECHVRQLEVSNAEVSAAVLLVRRCARPPEAPCFVRDP